MNIKEVFWYLGIEFEEQESLVNDAIFMEELERVHKYATANNMEYCLLGDEFRFDHKKIIKTREFAIFEPLFR